MVLKLRGSLYTQAQHITALVMLTVVCIFCAYRGVSTDMWRQVIFFSPYRWVFFLAGIMMYMHAFMGLYVVATDYVKDQYMQNIIKAVAFMYVLIACLGCALWL